MFKMLVNQCMNICQFSQHGLNIRLGGRNEFHQGFRVVSGNMRMSERRPQAVWMRTLRDKPITLHAQAFPFHPAQHAFEERRIYPCWYQNLRD